MKKTLSMLAVLSIISIGIQGAEAFCWSDLNPAYWGHCPKCQKVKSNCECKKKCNPCDNMTGGAANCNPCKKKSQKCDPCKAKQEAKPCPCSPCQTQQQNCEPCDKLQNMNK